MPLPRRVVGHQTLTVSDTAVSLTPPTGNVRVDHVIILVNDGDIRWRADGTAPTSAVGKTQLQDTEFELSDEEEHQKFKAIRKNAADAELDIIYEQDVP